jgi:lysophospholipase
MTKPPHPLLPVLPPEAEEPATLSWGRFVNGAGANIRFCHCPPPAGTAVKGHVIMLPGFKEPIEKYFEAMRDMHAQGLAVWMMDWRGQGGSDRYLPNEPHKAHHLGYEEQVASLHQFVTQQVLPRKPADLPLYLMAHSMGGHISLRYLHDHNQPAEDGTPGPITAAMLSAPMLDISTGATPKPVARQMARFAKAANSIERYIPGGGGWLLPPVTPPSDPAPEDAEPETADGKKPRKAKKGRKAEKPVTTKLDFDTATSSLTSDAARIGVMAVWFDRKPELALGDPTYGWIYYTLLSVDVLNQKSYLENIKTPVLMAISGDERVVVKAACERAAALMPQCQRLDIPDARHEIWMERDALRQRWIAAVGQFIKAHPGAGAAPKKPRAAGPKPPPKP